MQAVRLANGLYSGTYEPLVIAVRPGGPYQTRLRAEIRKSFLLPAWLRSSTLSIAVSTILLARQIEKLRPDAVCSFLSHTHISLAASLRRCRVPPARILALQNNLTRDLEFGFGPIRSWYQRALEHALRSGDLLVALSHGVARGAVAQLGSSCPPIEVIPNIGADRDAMDAALPVERGQSNGEPIVVGCGRLCEQKDFSTLIRAFKLVLERRSARLWILGEGKERKRLESLAQTMGIATRVKFWGFVENPYPFFKRASVFVLSSRWEGFGNVIVEAMACGCPVVSTRCDFGPDEIIEHERSGLLVPVGDSAQMATAIENVVDKAELRERLRSHGFTRARDFEADVIIPKFTNAIDRVMKARRTWT